jgi:hypothetical protein
MKYDPPADTFEKAAKRSAQRHQQFPLCLPGVSSDDLQLPCFSTATVSTNPEWLHDPQSDANLPQSFWKTSKKPHAE